MEGMRHKLSLPGLGMSKCTDPSGAAGCRVRRDTGHCRAQRRARGPGRPRLGVHVHPILDTEVVLSSTVLYGLRTNEKCQMSCCRLSSFLTHALSLRRERVLSP